MKRKALPNAMFKAFFFDQVKETNPVNYLNSYAYFIKHYGIKYSRIDQVKFVKDNL